MLIEIIDGIIVDSKDITGVYFIYGEYCSTTVYYNRKKDDKTIADHFTYAENGGFKNTKMSDIFNYYLKIKRALGDDLHTIELHTEFRETQDIIVDNFLHDKYHPYTRDAKPL